MAVSMILPNVKIIKNTSQLPNLKVSSKMVFKFQDTLVLIMIKILGVIMVGESNIIRKLASNEEKFEHLTIKNSIKRMEA
ncbi:MAG: hypothetical protein OEM89_08920 [Nitrosopumilus sp.]|nr:hypothetical protein [Nitrosopumilus sp.]